MVVIVIIVDNFIEKMGIVVVIISNEAFTNEHQKKIVNNDLRIHWFIGSKNEKIVVVVVHSVDVIKVNTLEPNIL